MYSLATFLHLRRLLEDLLSHAEDTPGDQFVVFIMPGHYDHFPSDVLFVVIRAMGSS